VGEPAQPVGVAASGGRGEWLGRRIPTNLAEAYSYVCQPVALADSVGLVGSIRLAVLVGSICCWNRADCRAGGGRAQGTDGELRGHPLVEGVATVYGAVLNRSLISQQ
jgi:hypothetical protein